MNNKKFQITSNAASWAGSNGISYIQNEKKDNNQISKGPNVNNVNKEQNKANTFQICSNSQGQNKNGLAFFSNQKPSSFNNIQIIDFIT